jgi:regulator of protease activity HflC (stomatin/prohibitin superfamily)
MVPIFFVVLFAIWFFQSVLILREYQRAVIYRMGRVLPQPKGPGLILVFWPIDQVKIIDLRLITLDVPPQDIITRDNVSAKVNAVVYFKVLDPIRAANEVINYEYATSQMAQTTLRSILGEVDLDDLLAQREKINHKLQEILDKQTDPWGIKVANVALKHVDLPEELRGSMSRQAQAERERRAKVINADGEFQAAEKICQAAQLMQKEPMSLQLRYLQTLVELGGKGNTTTIFPLPIEFLKMFGDKK